MTQEAIKPLNKTVEEILVERVGKVEGIEIYHSKDHFLTMFPNDYSYLITNINKKNHFAVKVFYGILDVTKRFLPGNTSKKVSDKVTEDLYDRIEKLELVEDKGSLSSQAYAK